MSKDDEKRRESDDETVIADMNAVIPPAKYPEKYAPSWAMHIGIIRGSLGIVKEAVNRGADVHKITVPPVVEKHRHKVWYTPLTCAVMHNHRGIVEHLVGVSKADVNIPDSMGDTPLIHAEGQQFLALQGYVLIDEPSQVYKTCKDIVAYLRSQPGIDPTIKNRHQEDASYWKNKHDKLWDSLTTEQKNKILGIDGKQAAAPAVLQNGVPKEEATAATSQAHDAPKPKDAPKETGPSAPAIGQATSSVVLPVRQPTEVKKPAAKVAAPVVVVTGKPGCDIASN